MHPLDPAACSEPSPIDPRQRCQLPQGHRGLHTVTLMWPSSGAGDDADTMKLPPIRDSIGRRRRPPALEELTDRAELIEAMGRELQRELRELRGDDLACYTCAHPASHHGGDGCDTWLAGEQRRCGCVADPHGDGDDL